MVRSMWVAVMKHHHHCRGWRDENPTDHYEGLQEVLGFLLVAIGVIGFTVFIVYYLCR